MLENVQAQKADFSKAVMGGAKVKQAQLDGASFTEAEASFSDFTGSEMAEAKMEVWGSRWRGKSAIWSRTRPRA